ncbi:MAG: hypothetical protein US42_C0003G0049 [Candidatus Magasanikbacteria bacterium GW2011_GWC2_37_14]|uniref:Uncharacterized protein n=1 Tax=Candidatus Magasanikbacteria bacterium GW2011_GWC2_37_14 TaxID=1619046 RepID=A0A0G0GDA9_9BACT|nr:MAG: hypothetical protein US42_C0003G0049 [Candidatus Magasanikbacteria bacterium GW2011_GWC2_37_14]
MELKNNFWFNYQLQNYHEVVDSFGLLENKRLEIISKIGKLGERIFLYVDFISKKILQHQIKPEVSFETNLIKYLDLGLLNNFINDPLNKENRDLFSEQLLLVYSALGGALPINAYSVEEMLQIKSAEYLYYDDNIFVGTLRYIFSDLDVFYKYLPSISDYLFRDGQNSIKQNFDWHTAFIYSALINFCWSSFWFLKSEEQENLLKNYFYTAIVAGVPVKIILDRFLAVGTAEEKVRCQQLFANGLENNLEEVPLNGDFTEWKKLLAIIRGFSVRIKGSNSGFEQEEFLKEFYQNQPGRDVYRGWLREVLNIVFSLEK